MDPSAAQGEPGEGADISGELRDGLLNALFRAGLDLHRARLVTTAEGEAHLAQALAHIDRLVQAIQMDAFATGVGHQRQSVESVLPSRQSATAGPVPVPRVDARDVVRLLDRSRALTERLDRVSAALAVTEDLLADAYERFAEQDGDRAKAYALAAQRARTRAEGCREMVSQVLAG